MQQPFGHEVGSQVQEPFTQCLPDPHGAELPQRQPSVGEQVSAVTELHVTQVPPLAPQVATPMVLQAPLAQQPFGQEAALQTQAPLLQTVPLPQAGPLPQRQVPVIASQPSALVALQPTQAAPAVPHVDGEGA